jgi:hypothetical protein
MKRRAHITLTYSTDLDMVPGWGHDAEDFVKLIEDVLVTNSAKHYNPKVHVHGIVVQEDKGFEQNLRDLFETLGIEPDKAMADFKARIEAHR